MTRLLAIARIDIEHNGSHYDALVTVVNFDNGASVDLDTGEVRNGDPSVLRRWVVPLVTFSVANGVLGAPREFLGSALPSRHASS